MLIYSAYLKEHLRQKEITILNYKNKQDIEFEKTLILSQNIGKFIPNNQFKESTSSFSTISSNNYEFYDKILNEKIALEDIIVDLKYKFANSQSRLIDLEDRNQEYVEKIEELEKIVKSQQDSLKLKEEVIKVFLKDKINSDMEVEPFKEALPKKKFKKQNSIKNMIKGFFTK